jgi:hypothetical protein
MSAEGLAIGSHCRERSLALAIYVGLSAVAHLAWEIAQLPLYQLWYTASRSEITFAVLHCTGGDVLIALSTLLAAFVLLKAWRWPRLKVFQLAMIAAPLGLVYTAFSEWLNVYVRQSWSYALEMPTLSIFGHQIGVSPLAQWVFVPGLVFVLLRVVHDRYIQRAAAGTTPR